MICKNETLNLRNLKIELSSCQCSMTSIGHEIETKRFVFRMQKKMYAKMFSQGHWTFLGPGNEKKCCGGCNYKPEGKWDSVASQRVQRFKETGHPIFTDASALSRGILRKLKGK